MRPLAPEIFCSKLHGGRIQVEPRMRLLRPVGSSSFSKANTVVFGVFAPTASAAVSFPKNDSQIQCGVSCAHLLHFYITYTIYVNFIYITRMSWHASSSAHVVTQGFRHTSCFTRVVTQELFYRRWFAAVRSQKLLQRSWLRSSQLLGVLLVSDPIEKSYFSSSSMDFSLLVTGAVRLRPPLDTAISMRFAKNGQCHMSKLKCCTSQEKWIWTSQVFRLPHESHHWRPFKSNFLSHAKLNRSK